MKKYLLHPPNDFAIATCSKIAIRGTKPMDDPSSAHISPNPNISVLLPTVLFNEKAGNSKAGSPDWISPKI